ncbi:hypothetical protein HOP51_04285 [Halomonas sp. MCCC 1A11036]|uniref:DUF1127 domain-containing protein n=1 Tax=Billgrantia zhangzhouensis TaxID=2733481 RepID=A0ABS9ABP6_9GAMM|nr:hypothetical protein [Halomonas zhangzhouensis]MCE8019340.1 hypothetical protein [Halomonas zhangzhouensis]
MTALRTIRRLLRAVRSFYANRQRDALLRDCDPRMLKDIGLRWERGKLVPINPERFAPKTEAVAASSTAPGVSESPGEVCPRCGARLA